MPIERFANNTPTTLNGGISDVATSLVVTSASTFPTAGRFRLLIDSEIIIADAVSGTTFSSLTRGAEGTAAAAHSNGATVTHLLTAGALDAICMQRVSKPASTTRNNTAVLADDPHLIVPLAATERVQFEAFLYLQGNSTAADWQFGWSFPTGGWVWWGPIAHDTTDYWIPRLTSQIPTGILIESSTLSIGSPSGAVIHLLYLAGMFITNGTAGNFTLKWAQNSATVADNVMASGSSIRFYKVV